MVHLVSKPANLSHPSGVSASIANYSAARSSVQFGLAAVETKSQVSAAMLRPSRMFEALWRRHSLLHLSRLSLETVVHEPLTCLIQTQDLGKLKLKLRLKKVCLRLPGGWKAIVKRRLPLTPPWRLLEPLETAW